MLEPYTHPLPSELIKHVSAICGERGVAWLNLLPNLIGTLEELWQLKAEAPFEKGEFNFVSSAQLNTGATAVLKIAPPYKRTEIFAEAEFLRSREGDGCIRLIAESRQHYALLLERASPGVTMDIQFDADPFSCVDPAIDVLQTILRDPTAAADAQLLDDWFDRFRRFRETDFSQDYGERALRIYERLSKQHNQIYYLHGDYHPGNIVTADRAPFLAIDPKGLIGHVGYDIAVFLNNLHWWQKGKQGVERELEEAVTKFALAFQITERDLREAAYACMVIGAWWTYEDMPDHYNDEVALADVWDIY